MLIYCVCSDFFFQQKTAYEFSELDWSSDVCSSDLFNGFGIRLDDIDEDISFESFDYEEKEPVNEIAYIFRSHPELNVSAVSRRMGIPQSLMAAYINGTKKPSVERKMQILETIKSIGHELISISHV